MREYNNYFHVSNTQRRPQMPVCHADGANHWRTQSKYSRPQQIAASNSCHSSSTRTRNSPQLIDILHMPCIVFVRCFETDCTTKIQRFQYLVTIICIFRKVVPGYQRVNDGHYFTFQNDFMVRMSVTKHPILSCYNDADYYGVILISFQNFLKTSELL